MFLSLSETLEKKKAGVHGSCVWISSWIKQITRKIKNTHLKKKNYFNIDKWKKFHEDKGVESSKNGEKQH